MTVRLSRRQFLPALFAAAPARAGQNAAARPVVLTFDDAVRSHREFVAPLLRDLGFRATFFVTHRWMGDRANFMTWEEIAEIHRMGFEIGNHSWTHANFAVPRNAARLAGELALVENELRKVGVPKPVSFAHCGNAFGPESVRVLEASGYRFARRGMQPEIPYGELRPGPGLDPGKHHRLLIPTTGDAYPGWTLEHFERVLASVAPDEIPVIQFHGVPDIAHPWVHTPPERFRDYMDLLKREGYRTLALRDLEEFLPVSSPPDPLLNARHPEPRDGKLLLPVEVEATRADAPRWAAAMAAHGYSPAEAAAVMGLTPTEAASRIAQARPAPAGDRLRVLPYPGGRHPRIGFLDGAIDPLRGTKASVFLPWNPASYVVVDLPEAIFSNLGLLFLAHTHIPTIWDQRNQTIENVDWETTATGGLRSSWKLPNQVAFGASLEPGREQVRMELWLANGTGERLTGLRTQICVMLARARGFDSQTNDNKVLDGTLAAVRSARPERWIATDWERRGRTWGNPPCPCLHADPVLPDCPPGETVRVRGVLWFAEGARPSSPLQAAL